MADSRDGWRGTPNKTGWKAIPELFEVQDPPPPKETPAAKTKKEFLQTLFQQDPKELIEWHAHRPEPDQQRFVQVLDDLYSTMKGKKKKPHRSSKGMTKARSTSSLPTGYLEKQLRPIAEHQPDFGSQADPGSVSGSQAGDDVQSVARSQRSVSQRSLRSSSSAPNIKPIDIFIATQRTQARYGLDGPNNTLQRWMDQRCATPASVSTDWTAPSQMTRTSVGTVQSAPASKYTLDYRKHARAMAINRRKWKVPDAHEPQSELVVDGTPEDRRLQTSYGNSYGVAEKGSTLRKETAYAGFNPESHELLENYLADANPNAKEMFTQVGRSLYTFKNSRHFSTSTQRAYDLDKNSALWKPGKVKPTISNPYASQVPIGNLSAKPDAPPPEYPPARPCPEVNLPPAFSCQ
jgi:hypothetical protein